MGQGSGSMGPADWMREALAEAALAADQGEVPVGAVLVHNGVVVGRGRNGVIGSQDPTAHAEIQALRQAGQTLQNYRLPGAELYVTLEPCAMCAGAIFQARLAKVYYAAPEPKTGVVCSQARLFENPSLNHHTEVVGGLLEDEARAQLQLFFRARR